MNGFRFNNTTGLTTTQIKPTFLIPLAAAAAVAASSLDVGGDDEKDAHADGDSDDDSLMDLHQHIMDEVTTTTIPTNHDAQTKVTEELLRYYLELKNEPVAKLNAYYQKKGVRKVQSYFCVHYLPDTKSFYYSFQCPLTNMHYQFGIPQPLFDSTTSTSTNSMLVKLAEQVFGTTYYIVTDKTQQQQEQQQQQVSFGKKKGAKKALAMAVLETVQQPRLNATALIVSSFGSSSSTTTTTDQQEEKCNSELSTTVHDTNPVPKWCHVLYDLGISSLTTNYEEYVNDKHTNDKNELLWNGSNVNQICCIMEASTTADTTTPVVVVGKPSPSRSKAHSNALGYLIAKLKQSQQPQGNTTTTHRAPFPNSEFIRYWKPMPNWAMDAPSPTMYLYQLRFTDSNKNEILSQQMGIDTITPMGILFPHKLPIASSIVVEFPIVPRGKRKSEGTLMVELVFSSMTIVELTNVQLSMLQVFNEDLYSWHIDYSAGGIQHYLKNKQTSIQERDSCGRTYLFVPLLLLLPKQQQQQQVDFELIQQVVNHQLQPYLNKKHSTMSLICKCFNLVLVLLVSIRYFGDKLEYLDCLRDLSVSISTVNENKMIYLLLVVLGCINVYQYYYPRFTTTSLSNRFFIQVGTQYGQTNIHVEPCTLSSETKTGKSRYLSNDQQTRLSKKEQELHQTKFNIDLITASVQRVYRTKFNVRLQYPYLSLVQGSCITKHGNQDLMFRNTKQYQETKCTWLVPELIQMLPLPRDFCYAVSQAPNFLPKLEQQMYLEHTATAFQTQIAKRVPPSLNLFNTSVSNVTTKQHSMSLVELVGAATKQGRTMQRLEFLGDTVLGFLVAVNLFALNPSLTWDADDLRVKHSKAVQNKSLAKAARHCGLGSIFWPDLIHYKSFYQNAGLNSLVVERQSKNLPFPSNRLTFRLETKKMSDMVEALLASLYLYERSSENKRSGTILLGFMELLNLPLSQEQEQESWFAAKSSCVDCGYAFHLDTNWDSTLGRMEASLSAAKDVLWILQEGRKGLLKVLNLRDTSSSLQEQLESQRAKLLLHCALYDDSNPNEKQLESCAIFRDTLFRVGHEALYLSVSHELYQRYPNASERDMTVQRLSAMSHDVVTYIVFKAGIHRFFFDQTTTALIKFHAIMEEADRLGRDLWSNNNSHNDNDEGWILGLDEFNKRSGNQEQKPRYMGIGGGRLLGQKQRLDDSIVEDFNFSMKTIAGALVLAIGMDGMWSCLGPLWEETLLLTAEEIRYHFGSCPSSAIATYFR